MKIKFLPLLFIFLSISIDIYSQDCPCDAVSLTVEDPCVSGTNVGSTDAACEDLVSYCSINPNPGWDNTVWYSFVATDDSITANFGEGTLGTNLVASVFSAPTGCSGAMSCLGFSNGGGEINVTGLTVGETYYIAVDGKNKGPTNYTGTFCIKVYETPPPPPPIGTLCNPRKMYVGPDCNNVSGNQYDEQNNIISTNLSNGGDGGGSMAGTAYSNSLETSCSGTDAGQQGYWVTFEALHDDVKFTNQGGESLDYALYSGDPCAGTQVAVSCTTIGSGSTSTISGLTSGTTYWVLITGAGSTNSTFAFLCIIRSANGDPIYDPSNDDCAGATVVSTSTNYELNNSNSTVDLNNSLCEGSTENNVWAVWTADFTGTAYINMQNQDCVGEHGMQMSIYETDGTCNTNNWSCIQYINPANDNDFYGTINAVEGVTYYIQFDGYAGCACTFDFCITTSLNPTCELLVLSNYKYEYFVKVVNENNVQLNWNIDENNIKNFVIERGTDLENFKDLQSVSNRGNVQYSYTDAKPNKGINYYRLRFVDQNGGVNYSDVKYANINNFKQLEVVPNPVSDKMSIEFEASTQQDTQVEIYDISGRKVFQTVIKSKKGLNNSTIDISSLQSGVYFVYVQKDDVVIKERFVKQ